MANDQATILVILLATMAMFLFGRWRHDMVALGALLACVFTGLVPGPTLTEEDARDYGGEQGFNTTGLLGVETVVISHTETETEIQIIPMRKAEPHEIRKFFSYL